MTLDQQHRFGQQRRRRPRWRHRQRQRRLQPPARCRSPTALFRATAQASTAPAGASTTTAPYAHEQHHFGQQRRYGGGISNDDGGRANITNSTISGNSADTSDYGGGGAIFVGSTVTLTNSTLSGNSANDGGEIYMADNAVTLISSIVANSPSGGNCNGPYATDGGNNLDSDGSCGLNGPTDKNKVDPQLGPLQANGGPTQTMALASTSPAINAIPPGTNGCGTTITTDQRGVPRPEGFGCDMGAYEYEELVYVANADSGPVTAYSASATGPVQPVRSIKNPRTPVQTTWDPWGVTFGPSSQLYVQSFLWDATTFVFPKESSPPGRIFRVNGPDSESIAVDGNGYQYVIGSDDGPVISVAAPGSERQPRQPVRRSPSPGISTDEDVWLPGRIC